MHRKVTTANAKAPSRPYRKLSGLQRYYETEVRRTLGFCSSTVKSEWHALQSFVIVWSSALV